MSRTISRVAGLALVALLVLPLAAPAEESAEDSGSPLKRVTFTFVARRPFQRVFLAGTFNGWSTDATPMRKNGDQYEITLPLAVGEYQYKFVADGEWITDEKAKRLLPDGYGGKNSVIDVDDSFPGMDMARGDGKILLDGLAHRGDAWERSLAAGGTVTMRTRAWTGDVEGVRLMWSGEPDAAGPRAGRTQNDDGGDLMVMFDSDGMYDYYQARLASPAFEYFFVFSDGEAEVVLDREGPREVAASEAEPFDFSASEVAEFTTPDWIKEGVIYQIFPERFANGSRANDPDFSEWYYEGISELPPGGKTNGEYFHFVDDWYEVAGLVKSPYKTDGKPDWNSFYGGDIAGVRENLDYLEDLGVTVIYFNPVFESKSNHKYDAVDYRKVDPHFGTNEEFAAFVDDCHARGMRVVVDLAINHSGHTHWAFVDGRERGEESEYWDWYEWKDWPLPGGMVSTPGNPLDYYDCWWGFGQMPNFNFDLSRLANDEQAAVDIDDAEPNWPLVNHLLDVTEYWLRDVGIDGYRLDVAAEVPFWFWELFRERVRATNPDAYILGELWGSSPEWVNGRYFDAVMNYKFFRDPVLSFIARGEYDAASFDRALAPGRLIYAEEGVYAQMNLLGSHDTERFLTTAGEDVRRFKLATLFAMTYVGAPSIYYGDEIGMTGVHDPDCRRPFLWNWTTDDARVGLHHYVRTLARLRRKHGALTRGSFETLVAEGKTYAFLRSKDDDHMIVVMNAGETEANVRVPLGGALETHLAGAGSADETACHSVVDELTGATVPVDGSAGDRGFSVTLPPLSGSVFSARPVKLMEGTGGK